MGKPFFYLSIIALILSCSSGKRNFKKTTTTRLSSDFYENQFTGFLVIDAENKDTLFHTNSKKYFTPASNTKIFTLFASLQFLPDSIPALKYIKKNDTLYIEGTGDPTLLHRSFSQNKTLDFLGGYTNIGLALHNYEGEKFGSGWAWDDYGYYYQPELGAFPLYGNVVALHNQDSLHVRPLIFNDSVLPLTSKTNRELEKNRFYFSPTRKDTLEVPFRTSASVTKSLLSKALNRNITLVSKLPDGEKSVRYSLASDTVLRRMMHDSDNFLAEQLLLMGSSSLSDTLSSAKARLEILENHLADLKQPPRWVDGSGLSRYNLFTPESLVAVLEKMHSTIPQERLFQFFPAGGVSGTLEEWYGGDPEPYIYAKSGSLGNVYCLSGYLRTKSGKTLIFSFMNNHFKHPSSELKTRMQQLFEQLRDQY